MNPPKELNSWTWLLILSFNDCILFIAYGWKDKLLQISSILPGAETPSIIELEGCEDRVAMHVVSREKLFWETMEELKKLGATSILVVPIEKMLD